MKRLILGLILSFISLATFAQSNVNASSITLAGSNGLSLKDTATFLCSGHVCPVGTLIVAKNSMDTALFIRKAHTWEIISSGFSGGLVNNGLSLSGDTIQLGGNLIKDTDIDGYRKLIIGNNLPLKQFFAYALDSTFGSFTRFDLNPANGNVSIFDLSLSPPFTGQSGISLGAPTTTISQTMFVSGESNDITFNDTSGASSEVGNVLTHSTLSSRTRLALTNDSVSFSNLKASNNNLSYSSLKNIEYNLFVSDSLSNHSQIQILPTETTISSNEVIFIKDGSTNSTSVFPGEIQIETSGLTDRLQLTSTAISKNVGTSQLLISNDNGDLFLNTTNTTASGNINIVTANSSGQAGSINVNAGNGTPSGNLVLHSGNIQGTVDIEGGSSGSITIGGSATALTTIGFGAAASISLNGQITATTATGSLDFPNTNAQTSSDLTINFSGAVVGDLVVLGVPNASTNANSCFTAWVSTSGVITVRFNNYSSAAINPASGTFKVKFIH